MARRIHRCDTTPEWGADTGGGADRGKRTHSEARLAQKVGCALVAPVAHVYE